MAQIFHRSFNVISIVSIWGFVFILAGLGWVLAVLVRSSYVTNAGLARTQPIQFSHAHHVGGLGIDCRYCHTSVEDSAFAGIPPTKTCMNCHSQIWTGSPTLEPVRESYKSASTARPRSLQWARVHRLADFAYFNHSVHVAKGVGCATCHGRVDQMQAIYQKGTLLMEWCLECHRQPEQFVRPRELIFNFDWAPDLPREKQLEALPAERIKELGLPSSQEQLGKKLMNEYHIRSLIECSTCHR